MYGKRTDDKIWGPRGWVTIGHQYVDDTKTQFVLTLNGRDHAVGERWKRKWTALVEGPEILEAGTMADLKALVVKS